MDQTPFFGSLESKYTILYLPALAYGFLSMTADTINGIIFEWSSVPVLVTEISAQGFFQICTVICIIGGVYFHRVLRLIFGQEGPSVNPKDTGVALKHMLIIITFVDLLDVEPNSWWGLAKEINKKANIRNWVRLFVICVPMGLTYVLMYLSPIFLYTTLVDMETLSVIGVILLITQSIFIAQNLLWRSDLSLVSPDSVDNIETPEYIRGQRALDERTQSPSQAKLGDFTETTD